MTRLYATSGERKYLNPSERMQFFETAVSIEHLAHKAFCLVLIYTGCRITEALNLTSKSIDKPEQSLVFKTLKQRNKVRVRALKIPDELITYLQQVPVLDGDTRLFPFSRWTGWRIVKHYMAETGLDGIKATPKGLRHAYAIYNLVNGAHLTKIQKWLGHERLEPTKIYLDYVGEDELELASRSWPDPDQIWSVGASPSRLENQAQQG